MPRPRRRRQSSAAFLLYILISSMRRSTGVFTSNVHHIYLRCHVMSPRGRGSYHPTGVRSESTCFFFSRCYLIKNVNCVDTDFYQRSIYSKTTGCSSDRVLFGISSLFSTPHALTHATNIWGLLPAPAIRYFNRLWLYHMKRALQFPHPWDACCPLPRHSAPF